MYFLVSDLTQTASRIIALSLTLLLACAFPAQAQTQAQTAKDSQSEESFLSRFLEDNLSGENQAIKVTGLSGALSSEARIAQLTVSDQSGVWLIVSGAELDWNRLALLRGDFSVNRLTAERIEILRSPVPMPEDPELPSPEASPFQLPELPVSVNLGEITAKDIVLSAGVIGPSARLALTGRLKLETGQLATTLSVERLDRPGDHLRLTASYGAQEQNLALDLSLIEAPGGLISSALSLPSSPSLELTLAGKGPINGFNAALRFASNGQDRLAGGLRLAGSGPNLQGLTFSAELGGNIDPLLHPDYRPFFGPDLKLQFEGQHSGSSGLSLQKLDIQSRALNLAGALQLSPQGDMQSGAFVAQITPPEGQAAVILPLPQAGTTLGRGSLRARLNTDRRWTLQADLEDLNHALGHLGTLRLSGEGHLSALDAASQALAGEFSLTLQGFLPKDQAWAAALGSELSLQSHLHSDDGRGLALNQLVLEGEDYRMSGDLRLSGFDLDLKIISDLDIGAEDLGRFSALAGRPVSGALATRVAGHLSPFSGAFALDLQAKTQDLSLGISALDTLLAGAGTLDLKGRRDLSGLYLEQLQLSSKALTAEAEGDLSSQKGTVQFASRIEDLNVVLPQLSGPLELTGEVNRLGKSFSGTVQLDGPNASYARLVGRSDLDGNADVNFDATLAALERLLPELPGDLSAKGKASRRGGNWSIEGNATAPAQTQARISGSFDEASGTADLTALGNLRLEGINPFIKPNLLSGAADFDLALKGAPTLSAIGGTVTLSQARLTLPEVSQSLEAIAGKITLDQSRATIDAHATPKGGGTLRLSGPIALRPPYETNLDIAFDQVVLSDHLSYDSIAEGRLSLAGALNGQALLRGRINLGETVINLNTAGGSVSAAPIPVIRHINESRYSRQTRANAGLLQVADTGSSGSDLALDLIIDAPGRIYARGRGLRAEMGGQIHLRGTTARLAPAGQIELIRGTFDILGRRLDLDEGKISLLGSLKPFLDLKSSASTASGTATLAVSGPIDAPEITVTSDPPRPSEEALALARLARSAFELSGRDRKRATSKLRENTGADRVDLGLDGAGGGLLGIGGYVSNNIYTDLNVNTGGESELSINLDLSKGLTVTGTVDSAGESGIGLQFSRDY